MDKTEVRRIAAAHGLTKLTDKHLEQFAESIKIKEKLVAGLPRDLHWSEEGALILRLRQSKESSP